VRARQATLAMVVVVRYIRPPRACKLAATPGRPESPFGVLPPRPTPLQSRPPRAQPGPGHRRPQGARPSGPRLTHKVLHVVAPPPVCGVHRDHLAPVERGLLQQRLCAPAALLIAVLSPRARSLLLRESPHVLVHGRERAAAAAAGATVTPAAPAAPATVPATAAAAAATAAAGRQALCDLRCCSGRGRC
jgi:hypothetical protein